MDTVMSEMRSEVERADGKYGAFMSTHEGLGVLSEEVAELVDAIRSNKLESVRSEAIQVAAVAFRLARSCREDAAFARRSGT